jgi:hypothetical protein
VKENISLGGTAKVASTHTDIQQPARIPPGKNDEPAFGDSQEITPFGLPKTSKSVLPMKCYEPQIEV